MGASLRKDAETIIADSIREVQPDSAVIRALKEMTLTGKIKLVAAGKAAWQMAKAASNYLGERLEQGIVITKYGHVRGELPIQITDSLRESFPASDAAKPGTRCRMKVLLMRPEKRWRSRKI